MTSTSAIDIYYYADNYNYTADYIASYQLSPETSIIAGLLYAITSAISLVVYVRIITVSRSHIE